MAKARKPNTARKPPVPTDNHADIERWIGRLMPDLHPIVKRLDEVICATTPGCNTPSSGSRRTTGRQENGGGSTSSWCLRRLRWTSCIPRRRGIRPSAAAWDHESEPLLKLTTLDEAQGRKYRSVAAGRVPGWK